MRLFVIGIVASGMEQANPRSHETSAEDNWNSVDVEGQLRIPEKRQFRNSDREKTMPVTPPPCGQLTVGAVESRDALMSATRRRPPPAGSKYLQIT